jgi:branched-chain amino acid transport system ATP-binding protein
MSGLKPLLSTEVLTAHYGDFQALYGISLEVGTGEVVGIIGANGAGKSTFLKCLSGLMPAKAESIRFDGQPIGGKPADQIAKLGVVMVPEGRRLFPSLTVEENILIGAHAKRPGGWTLEKIYGLFPALVKRRNHLGNHLSGGEQQMAAIGRALMANPRLLLFDEISLGLAPLIIKHLYAALPEIRAQGATVLLVEQDTHLALQAADRIYCFREGSVVLAGATRELSQPEILEAYFGMKETAHGLG